MKLNSLQSHLESLYDVQTPYRVEDFLLQDPTMAQQLSGAEETDATPEKLLVMQTGEDELSVSLFLHQDLVDRIEADSPAAALHAGNLQDFWFALEGVSHFLCLAWNASNDRPVSQLELELQAEVDKFILTADWVSDQQGRVALDGLLRSLFVKVRYRAGLSPDQLEFYREANRLAGRFCEQLGRRHAVRSDNPALANELRRFYRLPQNSKIRHIERSG
jgi:hypothetical protein